MIPAGPIEMRHSARPYDGKATAEVHDYHDELTGVLASSLAKRAPGYTSLGFPDPASFPTPPAPTRRARPSRKDRQHEADRGRAQRGAIRPRLRDRRRHHCLGDLVRVPGSGSGFIEDGEAGVPDTSAS